MKKDFHGREIKPGDTVLFLLQTGSQPGSKSLCQGKVLRSTEKWVEIEYASKYATEGKSITKRFDNLVLVPPTADSDEDRCQCGGGCAQSTDLGRCLDCGGRIS